MTVKLGARPVEGQGATGARPLRFFAAEIAKVVDAAQNEHARRARGAVDPTATRRMPAVASPQGARYN